MTRNRRVPAVRNRRDRDGSRRWREQRDCWAESFCLRVKMTEQPTTKVVCSICQAKFSYHLNAKHPTESSPRLDGRQPTLHDFTKITRPVRETVTNAYAVYVSGDCLPINIVEDGGLSKVIRIASGDNSYDLLSRGTI